jgi:hypothetical protein
MRRSGVRLSFRPGRDPEGPDWTASRTGLPALVLQEWPAQTGDTASKGAVQWEQAIMEKKQ